MGEMDEMEGTQLGSRAGFVAAEKGGWSGAGRTDDDFVHVPWGGTTSTISARYRLPSMQVCTGQYGVVLTNHPKQDIALSPVACRLAQAPHTLAPPSHSPPATQASRECWPSDGCQPARVGWRTRGRDQMSLVGHGCHGTAIPYSGGRRIDLHLGPQGAWRLGSGSRWAGLGQAKVVPGRTKVDQGHSTPLQHTPGRPTPTAAVAPSRMVDNVLQHINYGACGGQNGRSKAGRLGLSMRPRGRNRKSIIAIFTDSHRRLAD